MTETMTTTRFREIPSSPRYDLIRRIANNTILKYASKKVPLNLSDLVDCFNDIELRSYNWYQNTMGVSLEYIINKLTKSTDGGLLKLSDDNGKEEYMILYDSLKMVGRKRFTIAHELGHYLLKHSELANVSVLSRNELTEPEYKILEKEANFFARLLLVPLPLVSYMAKSWGPINRDHLIEIFNVTYTVSGNVINHINNQQIRGYLPINQDIVNKYKGNLNRYLNIHICTDCHSEFVLEKPSYCPICGNNSIKRVMSKSYKIYNDFERSDYMIYDGIEVDKNSKAKVCPICGNEEPAYGEHCLICGQYLVNKCTNVEHYNRSEFDGPLCGELLAGNARHCNHCGAQSTFLQNGILLTWQDVMGEESTGDAFDDIPF